MANEETFFISKKNLIIRIRFFLLLLIADVIIRKKNNTDTVHTVALLLLSIILSIAWIHIHLLAPSNALDYQVNLLLSLSFLFLVWQFQIPYQHFIYIPFYVCKASIRQWLTVTNKLDFHKCVCLHVEIKEAGTWSFLKKKNDDSTEHRYHSLYYICRQTLVKNRSVRREKVKRREKTLRKRQKESERQSENVWPAECCFKRRTIIDRLLYLDIYFVVFFLCCRLVEWHFDLE